MLTIDEYFFCINPCKFETLAPKSLCRVHVPLQYLKYQVGFSFIDFMVNCFDWHQMNFGKKNLWWYLGVLNSNGNVWYRCHRCMVKVSPPTTFKSVFSSRKNRMILQYPWACWYESKEERWPFSCCLMIPQSSWRKNSVGKKVLRRWTQPKW